jgi:hypothetical protein
VARAWRIWCFARTCLLLAIAGFAAVVDDVVTVSVDFVTLSDAAGADGAVEVDGVGAVCAQTGAAIASTATNATPLKRLFIVLTSRSETHASSQPRSGE